jgi:hypothetical protein
LEEVDGLLEKYRPGLPDMKPDVQKQLKELEEERAKMTQPGGPAGPQPCIVLQQPGQAQKQLTIEEVVEIMRQQQQHIDYMTNQIKQMQGEMTAYRQRILDSMFLEQGQLEAIPVMTVVK